MTPTGGDELWDLLRARVGPTEWRWLEDAVEDIRRDRSTLAKLFPAVGRHVGRDALRTPGPDGSPGPPPGEHGWTLDDASRALLLVAVGDDVWGELEDLYRFGDAAERRAVLRSLALLPPGDATSAPQVEDVGVKLVEDAIRSNDPRLIAAALGPYALDRLNEDAFNQAVLKCVFVGVPLAALGGSGFGQPGAPGAQSGSGGDGLERLAGRATPSLSRMLAGYVLERVAAGRDVPTDVWPLIELYPPGDLIAAIEDELEHPVEARRSAARAALAQQAEHRPAAGTVAGRYQRGGEGGTKRAGRET